MNIFITRKFSIQRKMRGSYDNNKYYVIVFIFMLTFSRDAVRYVVTIIFHQSSIFLIKICVLKFICYLNHFDFQIFFYISLLQQQFPQIQELTQQNHNNNQYNQNLANKSTQSCLFLSLATSSGVLPI